MSRPSTKTAAALPLQAGLTPYGAIDFVDNSVVPPGYSVMGGQAPMPVLPAISSRGGTLSLPSVAAIPGLVPMSADGTIHGGPPAFLQAHGIRYVPEEPGCSGLASSAASPEADHTQRVLDQLRSEMAASAGPVYVSPQALRERVDSRVQALLHGNGGMQALLHGNGGMQARANHSGGVPHHSQELMASAQETQRMIDALKGEIGGTPTLAPVPVPSSRMAASAAAAQQRRREIDARLNELEAMLRVGEGSGPKGIGAQVRPRSRK